MNFLQNLSDMMLYLLQNSIDSEIMMPLYYSLIVSLPAMLLAYLFKGVRRL